MTDFLINHALANTWCNPDQDNQAIFKPARITPAYGVFNSWKLMWTTIELPIKQTLFHIFQIGQLYPALANLFESNEKWTLISEVCNLNSVICDIYLSNGIEFPRSQTWYMVTEEKNILLALKYDRNINFTPPTQDIYIRVYRNAFYATRWNSHLNDIIFVEGKTILNSDEILEYNNKIIARELLPGEVYSFCNGYKVRTLDPTTVKIGDTVEYVYDSSIKKIIDFNIQTLGTFDSILDSKGKYLLHYLDNEATDRIDYRDEIDLFIVDMINQKGVRYHRNQDDSLRMLTHRDYSTPVSYVMSFIENNPTVLNKNRAYIRMHIRDGGYLRECVNEHNRIKELYKFDDTTVSRALLGIDSTVPNWRAPLLENSNYPKLMSEKYLNVNNALVVSAYGYNAVTKLMADTPVKTFLFNDQLIASAPVFFTNNSTAFEYDENGLFLKHYTHTGGELYNCVNINCKYVEFFNGIATSVIDEYHDATIVDINPNYDFRLYKKRRYDINSQWEDATDNTDFQYNSNKISWLQDPAIETLFRTDKNFYINTFQIKLPDGLFSFNLTTAIKVGAIYEDRVMTIPMGVLDIFLNGHYLIENLDYYVNFPRVIIVSKDYLKGDPITTDQEIVVRFLGLCNKDLSRMKPAETGFIRNGVISNNQIYNIRDDKVISVYIKGGIKANSDLKFNESNPSFDFTDVNNGKPYVIKDTFIPIKNIVKRNVYEYRDLSLIIDKSISDYMTIKIPEVEPTTLNPILNYHNVYSPFICKILFDLRNGILDSPLFNGHYNDDQLRDLLTRYLYILELDPIYINNGVDTDFVKIHPHHLSNTVGISNKHYTFLNRVVILYASGLVDLSANVIIV